MAKGHHFELIACIRHIATNAARSVICVSACLSCTPVNPTRMRWAQGVGAHWLHLANTIKRYERPAMLFMCFMCVWCVYYVFYVYMGQVPEIKLMMMMMMRSLKLL